MKEKLVSLLQTKVQVRTSPQPLFFIYWRINGCRHDNRNVACLRPSEGRLLPPSTDPWGGKTGRQDLVLRCDPFCSALLSFVKLTSGLWTQRFSVSNTCQSQLMLWIHTSSLSIVSTCPLVSSSSSREWLSNVWPKSKMKMTAIFF